jgi:hypothetical protein
MDNSETGGQAAWAGHRFQKGMSSQYKKRFKDIPRHRDFIDINIFITSISKKKNSNAAHMSLASISKEMTKYKTRTIQNKTKTTRSIKYISKRQTRTTASY